MDGERERKGRREGGRQNIHKGTLFQKSRRFSSPAGIYTGVITVATGLSEADITIWFWVTLSPKKILTSSFKRTSLTDNFNPVGVEDKGRGSQGLIIAGVFGS